MLAQPAGIGREAKPDDRARASCPARENIVTSEAREEEGRQVRTVSEVTGMVKSVLETSLPSLWVEGEISNFKHHSSGHMYFTLKDQASALPSLMFRAANQRLSFRPANGMRVIASGRIRVYEPQGRYQLYIDRMRPSGVGALAQAFEELKQRLAEEGLFDPAHRKPLPEFPRVVAVVTSPTGAAVRDVIRVIRSRAPMTDVIVVPAVVQGADAAPSIVQAIRALDAWGGADVAIVGRGGGSLEDLWAFNREEVARAIHAARTPVISAVGHEVDVTIADFVADARAATPSNAAELAVREAADVMRRVESLERRVEGAMRGHLAGLAGRVERLRAAYAFRLPREAIERSAQRVDEAARRADVAVARLLAARRADVARCDTALRLSDPRGIMARGYAAVSVMPDARPLRSVDDVEPGAEVRVTVADGRFDCGVLRKDRADGRET